MRKFTTMVAAAGLLILIDSKNLVRRKRMKSLLKNGTRRR
jgi:hypothetical protein